MLFSSDFYCMQNHIIHILSLNTLYTYSTKICILLLLSKETIKGLHRFRNVNFYSTTIADGLFMLLMYSAGKQLNYI